MENNQITDTSDLALAAETAHTAICTLRRYIRDENLSEEGRNLLFKLSDAAHNLPIMTSPSNKHWTSEEMHKDIAECQQLMTTINGASMYSGKTLAKSEWSVLMHPEIIPLILVWIVGLSAFSGAIGSVVAHFFF
jgi:hypothetical protein